MSKLTRITITVPTELLEAAERKLSRGERSRSALIRSLMEKALREAQERELEEQWLRAYQEQPQTEEEFGWQDAIAGEALEDLPWEERQ